MLKTPPDLDRLLSSYRAVTGARSGDRGAVSIPRRVESLR